MPTGASDFSRRLEEQLARRKAAGATDARNSARPAAVNRPESRHDPAPSSPAADDEFSRRLSDAARRRGGETEPDGNAGEPGPPPPRGPVGAGEHIVRQGECISSIAVDRGHFWQTLWDEPANGELRSVRKDPNVLLPEDRLHIPPIREKSEPGQTELRHRFRRKGWPETFRVRLLVDDEPRRCESYSLDVDGEVCAGTTDADGNVICAIKPNARLATLRVGEGEQSREYHFALGAIDPIDEVSGVQGRLHNLGFDPGPIDGKWGPRTEAAVRKFQASRGLDVTGEADETTKQKLQEDYGC